MLLVGAVESLSITDEWHTTIWNAGHLYSMWKYCKRRCTKHASL